MLSLKEEKLKAAAKSSIERARKQWQEETDSLKAQLMSVGEAAQDSNSEGQERMAALVQQLADSKAEVEQTRDKLQVATAEVDSLKLEVASKHKETLELQHKLAACQVLLHRCTPSSIGHRPSPWNAD